MKKSLVMIAVVLLASANAFATYWVVMKNGTTYRAKAKWTIVNGKALISLESGQSLQVDPALIDEARSEQATRSGLGDATVLATETALPSAETATAPSLGSKIRLRRDTAATQTAPPVNTAPAPPAGGMISTEIIEKFQRAYENVGLFEQNIKGTGPHSLRAELTADSEDKVFNAISATSFLITRNAGVPGADIQEVELFMRTTNGGSSGRFKMTRADATAIDSHQISQQEYFVRNVIF